MSITEEQTTMEARDLFFTPSKLRSKWNPKVDCKCCGKSIGYFKSATCDSCGSVVHKDSCLTIQHFKYPKKKCKDGQACSACVTQEGNRVREAEKHLIRLCIKEYKDAKLAEKLARKAEARICASEEVEISLRLLQAEIEGLNEELEATMADLAETELESGRTRDLADKVKAELEAQHGELEQKKAECALLELARDRAPADICILEAKLRTLYDTINQKQIDCGLVDREKVRLLAEIKKVEGETKKSTAWRDNLRTQKDEKVAFFADEIRKIKKCFEDEIEKKKESFEEAEQMKKLAVLVKKSDDESGVKKKIEREISMIIDFYTDCDVHSIDGADPSTRNPLEYKLGRDSLDLLFADMKESASKLKSLLKYLYPLIKDIIDILSITSSESEGESRGDEISWVSLLTIETACKAAIFLFKGVKGTVMNAMLGRSNARVTIPDEIEPLVLSTDINVVAADNKEAKDLLRLYRKILVEARLLIAELKLKARLPFTAITASSPKTATLPSKDTFSKFAVQAIAIMRAKLSLEGEMSDGDPLTMLLDAFIDCFKEKQLRFASLFPSRSEEDCLAEWLEKIGRICDVLMLHKNRLMRGANTFASSLKSMKDDKAGTAKKSLINEYSIMFDGILDNLDIQLRFLEHQKMFCSMFKDYHSVAFCCHHLVTSLRQQTTVETLTTQKFPNEPLDDCLETVGKMVEKLREF